MSNLCKYQFQACGSVGFNRWTYNIPAISDADAIRQAQDAALYFASARGFMHLNVWCLDGNHADKPIAQITINTPTTTVRTTGDSK